MSRAEVESMDETFPRPRLEKRLMPLLDVALSLVGILILMVGISREEPSSGIEGNVARIEVRTTGEVVFGDRILASNETGVNQAEVDAFLEELNSLEDPLVLLYYALPSQEKQSVDRDLVIRIIQQVESSGTLIRIIGTERPSEEK